VSIFVARFLVCANIAQRFRWMCQCSFEVT